MGSSCHESRPCLKKVTRPIRPPARKKQHLSRPTRSRDSMADPSGGSSNIVDVDLLLACAIGLVAVAVVAILVELEADTLVALVAVGVCLVDLRVLG